MISGRGMRPGDILTAANGMTVEVTSFCCLLAHPDLWSCVSASLVFVPEQAASELHFSQITQSLVGIRYLPCFCFPQLASTSLYLVSERGGVDQQHRRRGQANTWRCPVVCPREVQGDQGGGHRHADRSMHGGPGHRSSRPPQPFKNDLWWPGCSIRECRCVAGTKSQCWANYSIACPDCHLSQGARSLPGFVCEALTWSRRVVQERGFGLYRCSPAIGTRWRAPSLTWRTLADGWEVLSLQASSWSNMWTPKRQAPTICSVVEAAFATSLCSSEGSWWLYAWYLPWHGCCYVGGVGAYWYSWASLGREAEPSHWFWVSCPGKMGDAWKQEMSIDTACIALIYQRLQYLDRWWM